MFVMEKEKDPSQKTHRLSFDFTPIGFEMFTKLKERSGAKNNAEVIRDACTLYEWYLELQDKESQILVRHKDGTTEKITFTKTRPVEPSG
jgi:hypothetical protein